MPHPRLSGGIKSRDVSLSPNQSAPRRLPPRSSRPDTASMRDDSDSDVDSAVMSALIPSPPLVGAKRRKQFGRGPAALSTPKQNTSLDGASVSSPSAPLPINVPPQAVDTDDSSSSDSSEGVVFNIPNMPKRRPARSGSLGLPNRRLRATPQKNELLSPKRSLAVSCSPTQRSTSKLLGRRKLASRAEAAASESNSNSSATDDSSSDETSDRYKSPTQRAKLISPRVSRTTPRSLRSMDDENDVSHTSSSPSSTGSGRPVVTSPSSRFFERTRARVEVQREQPAVPPPRRRLGRPPKLQCPVFGGGAGSGMSSPSLLRPVSSCSFRSGNSSSEEDAGFDKENLAKAKDAVKKIYTPIFEEHTKTVSAYFRDQIRAPLRLEAAAGNFRTYKVVKDAKPKKLKLKRIPLMLKEQATQVQYVNGKFSSFLPVLRLPGEDTPPRMKHWVHIEHNIKVDDNLRLSHIPYIDDEHDSIAFCRELKKAYPEGIHGVSRGWGMHISDYLLFRLLQSSVPNWETESLLGLDYLYRAIFKLFPNKWTPRQMEYGFTALELRFSPRVLDKSLATERGEDIYHSISTMMCVKCLQFDCILHGERLTSEAFRMHRKPLTKKPRSREVPCGRQCYLLLPEVKAEMEMDSEDSAHEDTIAEVAQVEQPEEEAGVEVEPEVPVPPILKEAVCPFDESAQLIFEKMIHNNRHGPCQLAAMMDAVSPDEPKCCQEVYYLSLLVPEPDRPRSPEDIMERKITVREQQSSFRNFTWTTGRGQVDNSEPPAACRHAGPCGVNTPDCYCGQHNTLCSKYCSCGPDCRMKFPGCRCQPGACRTKQCQCFYAKWECDPDTCKSCNCGPYAHLVKIKRNNCGEEQDGETAEGACDADTEDDEADEDVENEEDEEEEEVGMEEVDEVMPFMDEEEGEQDDEDEEQDEEEESLPGGDAVAVAQSTNLEIDGADEVVELNDDVTILDGSSEDRGALVPLRRRRKKRVNKPLPVCSNISIQRGAYKSLRIGISNVAGFGCFIYEEAEKGEFIAEYTGEVISKWEAERRGRVYDEYKCSYIFALNKEQSIDATRYGNHIRFANHSDKHPNCYSQIIMVNGEHRIGIFAKRKIEWGEELLFDYQYDKKWKEQYVPVEINKGGKITGDAVLDGTPSRARKSGRGRKRLHPV